MYHAGVQREEDHGRLKCAQCGIVCDIGGSSVRVVVSHTW